MLPNPTRVAALTAAAAPVALAGVGLFDWLPLPIALAFGMALPALIGYLAARCESGVQCSAPPTQPKTPSKQGNQPAEG